ncbi:CoA binding domain-containing protein [Phyllosticta citrichinensis]|uniref:CoA binding domain-containing protein n=1 Tax=Phyllosticta citrichinensis TaxID=1130410 RepID=A0ABR1XLR4_9PEZI
MDAAATQALKTFFTSPRFAVAGASSDPTKFGHKIFAWYLTHSLPVTPLNPRAASITAGANNTPHATLPSPSALPAPADTALSVVTPPRATLALLREAKEVGVRAVWLQPGTFDAEVEAFVLGESKAEEGKGNGGEGGEGDKDQGKPPFEAALFGSRWGRGGEGWCVLVDGEEGLRVAGREWRRARI